MMLHIRRSAMARFIIAYIALLLSCAACRATSSHNANIDGHRAVPSKEVVAGNGDEYIDESEEAVRSITSRLSSWMKEKQKHNSKSRKQGTEEGLPPQRVLPFVTLAYAQTLDGMIAARCASGEEQTTSNMRLSGAPSMVLTHRLRSMHDAILVGGSTFSLDAPRLNVRLPSTLGVAHDSVSAHNSVLEQPMPVVLDTNLDHLQLLLFGKIVTRDVASPQSSKASKKEDLPDIIVDKIRANNPVICCSSNATHSFLDMLEIFRDQQEAKRKTTRSYKINVYKTISDEGDREGDLWMPIKITVRVVTHHSKKHEEDVSQDLTLTLLPCPIDERRRNKLDVEQVLHQLHDQLGVNSVMVEGGAGVLSSFLDGCVDGDAGGLEAGGGGNQSSRRAAHCICATIVPKIIGGKWGLPVFGGFDVLPKHLDGRSARDRENDDDQRGKVLPMMSVRDGGFVPLGPDCIFLGRM
mmetsp:Transcript_37677/g.80474  ORF Transcript_37677/g.80474 Transcript_37677/m.80474 type:complete len:466 (-) Transcript_37677:199-1596(-)